MLKENYQRVKDLLITKPETRDNDNLLLSMIWKDDIMSRNDSSTSKDLFNLLANGELTNFESVRRVRQKIQEENPELRGKKYKYRVGELEIETKQEVKELTAYEKWHGVEKKYQKNEGDLF